MSEEDGIQKRRTQIMNEIVETENDYLSNLTTLKMVYLYPIKSLLERNPKIVNDNLRVLLLTIRSDIEVIIGIQKQFLSEISTRTMEWDDKTKLADIFLAFADTLKIYFSYMNHYQTIIPLLTKTKGTEFAEKLQEMKKPSCSGKGLRDYLIMPAQRIPRYLMLLSDLLRKTPESHPDYFNLSEAKKKFSALSDKVDEDLADFKSLETVMQLSASLVFSRKDKHFLLVEPHRRFSQEVNVRFLIGNPEENSESVIEGRLIIFNDILLLCVPRKDKKKVKRIIYLDKIKFESKVVRGEEALFIQKKKKAICIWPKKQMNLKETIAEIIENRNHGKTLNLTTVPVTKSPVPEEKKSRSRTLYAGRYEPPKMLKSHSSFAIASAADIAALKRKTQNIVQASSDIVSSCSLELETQAAKKLDIGSVRRHRSKSEAKDQPASPRTRRHRRESKRKRNSVTLTPIPKML